MSAFPASIAHVRSSNGGRFESTRPTPALDAALGRSARCAGAGAVIRPGLCLVVCYARQTFPSRT